VVGGTPNSRNGNSRETLLSIGSYQAVIADRRGGLAAPAPENVMTERLTVGVAAANHSPLEWVLRPLQCLGC